MRGRATLPGIVLAAAVVVLAASPLSSQETAGGAGEAGEAGTSCLACHGDADLFDEEGLAIVELFQKDVHAAADISCHDCHGGNPAAEAAEDLDLAKDESFAGAPGRRDIPAFCGRCHSDPDYMKRFRPDVRVDQEREYWTSQHGRALEGGNVKVATCIDCHSVHGILGADDPESQVYPTQVAETCRSCHSSSYQMAGATLPDGRPLPTDQYVLWRRSVHARALLDGGDLSAPTCNDCHGNHGAAPPGVESVAYVCGQCHGREARLFRASRKHAKLQEHNEYLQDAGEEGCASCHEPPEPQAQLTTVRSLAECTICHGNHAVVGATVAILANLPETPCVFCHEGSGPLSKEMPESEKMQRSYEETKDGLLAQASDEGLAGMDLFNWMVDQALVLPNHTLLPEGGEGGQRQLRPEFQRLYEKFRIGKSYYTYEDPDGGRVVQTKIYRCDRCHGAGTGNGDQPGGLETAKQVLDQMQELTALTAQAERMVLSARRGGVETREALAEIDHAVDAQIGLEVLVHTFDASEGSAFAERQKEGLDSARAAVEAGQTALDELGSRRNWLAIALVFIAFVVVGLALKIRELSAAEAAAAED